MDQRPAQGRESLRALPPLTAVTAAMFGSAAGLLVAGAIAWQPGKNPRWVISALAVTAVVFFVWVWLRGRRFTATEALVMTAVQLATIGGLTWTTQLPIGAFANGTVLPIVGVYATWFLHPVAGRVVLYLGTLWWFAAIVHHGDSTLATFGASLVVQTLVATEALSRIKHRLDRLANMDSLTGMLNRRGITAVLEQGLEQSARRRRPLSVVAIDVDDLREVNNTRGHRAGDQLLESLAQHWITGMRRGEAVGRTGGDEFLFVLPATTELEAEALVQRVAANSPGSWSAGVAETRSGDTATSLLERADRRMYIAKAARRSSDVLDAGSGPSV